MDSYRNALMCSWLPSLAVFHAVENKQDMVKTGKVNDEMYMLLVRFP